MAGETAAPRVADRPAPGPALALSEIASARAGELDEAGQEDPEGVHDVASAATAPALSAGDATARLHAAIDLVAGIDVSELPTPQALGELLDDPGKRAELGAAAVLRAKEFSWRASAQRHREIYQRAARARSGSR